jgi:hypothetical protein
MPLAAELNQVWRTPSVTIPTSVIGTWIVMTDQGVVATVSGSGTIRVMANQGEITDTSVRGSGVVTVISGDIQEDET